LERTRRIDGKRTIETVCAITSLSPQKASAETLLKIARGHWEIENRLHWVRDVCLGEDACRVRSGAAPQVLGGLRNTVLYVLRATGLPRIAEAFRHLAARPEGAVQRIMQPLP
jgi:predicted transposase YbfD/YdcC